MNPSIRNWEGQYVWLVGASSGIGKALAETLLKHGAVLALSARRIEPLQALIAGKGPDHLALALDTTIPDQLQAAHEKIRACWPRIDTVIWLAGTYQAMRADSIDLDVVKRTLDANLTSVYNGLATIVPAMLSQGSGHNKVKGSIVLVASVAGYRGLPKALVYGPSKAGLINLAEVLYTDLKPKGISVFLVNPGFVETPLTAQNDFKMPALISSEEAAREILNGMAKGQFEIHFPKRFSMFLKLLRVLPYRLYFALTKNLA